MKLSGIDTSIYYPITIPSTKTKTKFRPFRVREERALLTAQESEDSFTMLHTLEQIVKDCVKDCPDSLTTFDVEYIFVQIRSKSVGEVSDVIIKCSKCDEQNNVSIDLSNVKLTNMDQEKTLKLAKNLVVVMKYPTISEIAELVINLKDTEAIAACIESVFFNDEVFHTKDGAIDEVVEFLLNRSEDEMKHIVGFVENIPTVMLDIKFKCTSCGEQNEITIKTLADFF